ncbi:MAG: hydantoinase/oxoprolinase family protein [Bacillota bacterium]
MTDVLHPLSFRSAVDCGGTFTGACMIIEKSGRLFSVKVPSTPEDPSSAVMQALAELCRLSGAGMEDLNILILGATAANPIAKKIGDKTALLVTRGFRDILRIGRQAMPNPYLPAAKKAPPLIPGVIFEVSERILPGGHVRRPLAENEITAFIVPRLRELGIESIAVCFLHSYDNPLHEQRVKDIITGLMPGMPVTISSDIAPFPGEYERAVATVLNAALTPAAGRFIEALTVRLAKVCGKAPGLFIFQSDGRVMTAPQAAKESFHTVLSSPAGGVAACSRLSASSGRPNIVTLEMGGASTFISIIHKDRPGTKKTGATGAQDILIAAPDIKAVGVGGGSTAVVESGGLLKVGPESAGYSPGPACFARGGTIPTCTDANLILGRIIPETFSPAGVTLEMGPALDAVEKNIACPLGITIEQAAEGIIKMANSAIVRAARKLFAGAGYDPGEFTLVSFGGSGPAHAAEIAREIGIPSVLIPLHSGVYPSMGMLFADLQRDYSRPLVSLLAGTGPEFLENEYRLLEEIARGDFLSGGISGPLAIERSAGIRYEGQSHVLNMQVPSGKLTPADLKLLGRAFGVEYETRFGFPPENSEAEITGIGLTVTACAPPHIKSHHPASLGVQNSFRKLPVDAVKVTFDGEHFDAPVYYSNELCPGSHLNGPAVISHGDSAAVVWPGMTASVDARGNIIISTVVK